MGVARYVVDAVVLEGRSCRDVAAAHGVSKSFVAKMVGRYRSGGYDALKPRSRAPNRIPHRTPDWLEDEIVALRKQLQELGVDAGAQTIHYHLSQRRPEIPSVSTIWRILKRRGFITPQPHKRPRSSWIRFEAQLPNERWQADVTHWRLSDDSDVEICNVIDDYSRVIVASRAMAVATAPKVVEVFEDAGKRWGFPACLLTDNGCVFTATHRGGTGALQVALLERGIAFRHSRPYHPQTCGKVERFHQTLKGWLGKQPRASTIDELQGQLDWFAAYYNDIRPHRARGRTTPRAAFDGRDKARPTRPRIDGGGVMRVRHDRVDNDGKITIRHKGRLHHIGVGRAHNRERVVLLVAGLDLRVLNEHGELLGRLTLDPARNYQPMERA